MTLFHADARDIVVRDAACAVSDVPYRLTMGGKSPHPDAPRGGWLKDYNNKGQPVTCDISWDEIMDLLFRSLAARSHAYVFTNDKNLREAMNAADRAGFRLHNVLLWNKRSAMPNRWYMKPVEFVLFLGKGKAFTINQPGSMSLVEMPWPDETNHPTEKPWPLLQRYIRNSTDEGASVFDPFMGSGSTGVAAAKLGREFIGVEIEREWFDVAEKRIAKADNEFQKLGVAS
ncbi:DNA-methyltransferase [Cohaesibacter celericrescens]|uniref:Methyltransferase n=1 Tax=Cohaesibacter celericrescens TaxID=2067669 RepID=A0A2N5XX55_9HYPH|nr:site-specific DNA-methyltransferase [Cohaesibacter celericrescens]PLW79084.1 site-specific DNA-methyltransferase [Cohaesibacter celericrescens]